MPTALLLSPHLDDAAFSCGGTAAMLAAAGWEVALVTPFAASVADPTGFALECQTSKGLPPEVDYMRLRRTEDAVAAVQLGCTAVAWGTLREAPHRGYESAAMLFEPPLVSDDRQPIADAVAKSLTRHQPDLLLAPQCWGQHVDHVQLTRSLLAMPRPPTAWWEDLPYLLRDDPRPPPDDIAAAIPAKAVAVRVAAEAMRAKLDACAAYASQLGFQFGDEQAMRRRLGSHATERFVADAEAIAMLADLRFEPPA